MQANRFFWAIYISLHFKHAKAACIQQDLQYAQQSRKLRLRFPPPPNIVCKGRKEKMRPKREPEVIFLLRHNTELLSLAWEGQKCEYLPKDPQTMCAKCCLSCGCFPGCSKSDPLLCSHPWARTNWFVPFGVHLERGHRYGMHTSPGGCWCHCGTCPLHSQPLSRALIYLHSLLFSRELNWKQRRIALFISWWSFWLLGV